MDNVGNIILLISIFVLWGTLALIFRDKPKIKIEEKIEETQISKED